MLLAHNKMPGKLNIRAAKPILINKGENDDLSDSAMATLTFRLLHILIQHNTIQDKQFAFVNLILAYDRLQLDILFHTLIFMGIPV
jgi:hypothetical protein